MPRASGARRPGLPALHVTSHARSGRARRARARRAVSMPRRVRRAWRRPACRSSARREPLRSGGAVAATGRAGRRRSAIRLADATQLAEPTRPRCRPGPAPHAGASSADAIDGDPRRRCRARRSVDECAPSRRPRPAPTARRRRSRSGSAAPTPRSCAASTAGRRAGEERLVLGHESLGRVLEAPDGSGFAAGDLVVGIVRRPDPVPCAPVRGGRVGLLRQRPVHRARDQGAARLRLGALAGRARASRSGSTPALEDVGVLARADEHRREGVGADRAHRRAVDVRAAHACSSPAPGRSGCWRRCWPSQRGYEVHVLDQVTDGPEARARAPSSAAPTTRATRRAAGPFDIVVEATGAGRWSRKRCARPRRNGDRLPHRRLVRRPLARLRHRRLQPRRRARERRRVRHRQREPPPPRGGGGGARRRRPRRGCAALITRRVPLDRLAGRARAPPRRRQGRRRALDRLRRRADQDLVDVHVRRLRRRRT